MRETLIATLLLLAVMLVAQGCAAVGLLVVGSGVGVAAGTGTAYTLDGIAYRTFTVSEDRLHDAAVHALRRLDMQIERDDATTPGHAIVALASNRTIHIELERLTSRTTRMRVTAKQGWFFRDRSTAGEIIAQTDEALDTMPALSRQGLMRRTSWSERTQRR